MPKLWVQLKPHFPVIISTQDCEYISEFIDVVQKKLSVKLGNVDADDISLSLPSGSTLAPDVLLSDLLNQPGFNNTAQTPLFISVTDLCKCFLKLLSILLTLT
jgi:hypothetical protein